MILSHILKFTGILLVFYAGWTRAEHSYEIVVVGYALPRPPGG